MHCQKYDWKAETRKHGEEITQHKEETSKIPKIKIARRVVLQSDKEGKLLDWQKLQSN